MSFPWSAYLDVADVLIGVSTEEPLKEASYRTAISRAYYAAFCTARNAARDHEGVRLTETGRDHGLVIRHYRGRTRAHRAIAIALLRLRDIRGQVDYEDAIDEDLFRLAQNAVEDAREVLASLERIH